MQRLPHSELNILFARAQELKAQGIEPYPRHFVRTHSLCEANDAYEGLSFDSDGEEVALSLCGRLMDSEDFGDIILITIEDQDSRLQLVLDGAAAGQDALAKFRANVYRGDQLGFEVDYIYRERGRLTARVIGWQFLALCSLPLPRRIDSPEREYRQRYVHLAANIDARLRFVTRSKVLRYLRRFLEDQYAFLEVETPRPDASLPSSPEQYLKRLLIGGIERVYEISRRSGDEAVSWHTYPESQVMRGCMMLADLEDMMKLTEQLIAGLTQHLNATRVIPWKSLEQLVTAAQQRQLLEADPDAMPDQSADVAFDDMSIDLVPPWSRRSVYDLARDVTGVDFTAVDNVETAVSAVRWAEVELDAMATFSSVGDVLAELVRQVVGPSLIQPTFLVFAAPEPGAFAGEASYGSRFQLYINGLLFAEGGSGQTDPAAQALDDHDDDFLTALKYGLPPSGALTVEVDRLVMLMTGAMDIRDVICFPIHP